MAGPAYGGIILAHEVAKNLSEFYQHKVLSVFTEKDINDKQVLKRPVFRKIVAGSLVLVVDDILSTGCSVLELIREIQNTGGHVMGISVICNRGGVQSSDIMDYPLYALWNTDFKSYEPKDCSPCKENIPLEDPKSC